jgi:hypothetical protein
MGVRTAAQTTTSRCDIAEWRGRKRVCVTFRVQWGDRERERERERQRERRERGEREERVCMCV